MSGDAALGAALEIQPLYARLVRDPVQPWRGRADWAVSQRVDHPDTEAANRLSRLDLEGGADAVTLVAAASASSRGYGLTAPDALEQALEGVELDLISLRLDAGAGAPAFAKGLAKLVEARRLGSAGLDLDLGFDPVALAARGRAPEPGAAAAMVALSAEAGLAGRPLLADGRPWHEAGATEARELALVLAAGVAQLRMLESGGLSLDAARRAIAVLLPFDTDVLLGLAKARAMRRLWARLEAVCGLEPIPLKLHAETSWRMMTRYDPWTNAMRSTAATFAAGLGGADAITVLPMTLTIGLPDAAARRLARNTGRVLLDEANLGRVADPGAGSGAIEALTDDLCHAAWSRFQKIEHAGGIEAGLRDGRVQAKLEVDAAARRADVASLARGIVGTTRFPRLDAPQVAVIEVRRHPDTSVELKLPSRRDAEPFELLRDESEARAATGRRPRVVLATLGEPAAFGARATTASNLFAAAGIATDPPSNVLMDIATIANVFRQSGASTVCICGSDAAYAREGEACVAALRGGGALSILVLDGMIKGADPLPSSGDTVLRTLGTVLRMLTR